MSLFLGIDTSNYTTSVALYSTATGEVVMEKKLLPVKEGEKGIRQSDAVFHHTQRLSVLLKQVLETYPQGKDVSQLEQISAVGVSTRPRRAPDSYMPCFTVGLNTAASVAAALGVPLYEFSHQEGHVAAALYSAGKLDLVGQEFLAFHVSGGTTESLLVSPGQESPLETSILGTSSDLKAGMAIDRVGLSLGLPFPAGPALEELALQSTAEFKIHPSMKGADCSLSGVENKCKKMQEEGASKEDIANFCLSYIEASLGAMADALLAQYPNLFLVFSGGVMSNSIIRNHFLDRYRCCFAEPKYSADNAAGIAVLTSLAAFGQFPEESLPL